MNYQITEEQSNDKLIVYSYKTEELNVPLNSLYSPTKEAERFIKRIKDNRNMFCIFIGLGNGELLEQIIKSDFINRNIHCLFVEPFPEVPLKQRHRDIFSNNDKLSYVHFKDFSPLLFSKYLSKFIGIPTNIQVHPNYSKTNDSQLKACLQILREGIFTKVIMDNTEKRFSVDWILEPLLNIPYSRAAINIKDLKDKYKGEKAILAASGPSLKENLNLLKEVKDFIYIFSVGSALRALLKDDIEPDFVTSVDASDVNFLTHFEGVELSSTLIYETMSNSNIQKEHKGPLVVARSSGDYISNEIPDLYTFPYQSPSVAIFTLQVIEYLGFSEIYLIGQDLALLNGEYYAEGIKRHDGMLNVETELWVENNEGEKVGTTRPLKIFLDSMESVIQNISNDCTIFNLSAKGAKIKGTRFISTIETGLLKQKEPAVFTVKSIEDENDKLIKNLIISFKTLQRDVANAMKSLDLYLNRGFIPKNDMGKIVKQFKNISRQKVLNEIILSKLTFEFNKINNVFLKMELKNNYKNNDLLNMIRELNKFYTVVSNYLNDILADMRLERFL